jgi:hypothetical protein
MRQSKDDPTLDEDSRFDGRGGKSKIRRDKKEHLLTADEKHGIATTELDTLKRNIEEGREKSEGLLESLNVNKNINIQIYGCRPF